MTHGTGTHGLTHHGDTTAGMIRSIQEVGMTLGITEDSAGMTHGTTVDTVDGITHGTIIIIQDGMGDSVHTGDITTIQDICQDI